MLIEEGRTGREEGREEGAGASERIAQGAGEGADHNVAEGEDDLGIGPPARRQAGRSRAMHAVREGRRVPDLPVADTVLPIETGNSTTQSDFGSGEANRSCFFFLSGIYEPCTRTITGKRRFCCTNTPEA